MMKKIKGFFLNDSSILYLITNAGLLGYRTIASCGSKYRQNVQGESKMLTRYNRTGAG